MMGAVRVAVAGAGIGGFTLAVSLRRHGHDVVLLERASAFGAVGAGIQVSPNASRILHALGLADALAAIGTVPDRIVMRRWADDRVLLDRPLGTAAAERYGHPYFNVYRPDLVEILAAALGDVDVRLGASVTSMANGPDGATVVLADGSLIDADVVVGADGIHSTVRSGLLGAQPTRFSGYVAYRALVPGGLVADLPVEVTNRVGPDQHLVSYFVGRHRRFYNLVCVVHDPTWDVESWTEEGSLADLRAHFAGWAPAVDHLLSRVVEPVHRWALHDRHPLARWSDGRITLLGDACHPMLPFMAQGACQAIEDAAVLTRCLDGAAAAVPGALARYETARRPRTSDIQARSWDNCTAYHLPDGDAQRARDASYEAAAERPNALAAFDWLYGHDASTEPLPT